MIRIMCVLLALSSSNALQTSTAPTTQVIIYVPKRETTDCKQGLLVLPLRGVEVLWHIHLDRVLDASESLDAEHEHGDEDEEHDEEDGDESWSEDLVSFEDAAFHQIVVGAGNTGAGAGGECGEGHPRVYDEVVRECSGNLGILLLEIALCSLSAADYKYW